jgi:hypothetical protein
MQCAAPMSFLAALLLYGSLAATTGPAPVDGTDGARAGASGDVQPTPAPAAPADTPPPGYVPPPPGYYVPPPPVYPPPPAVYGPPPVYVQPIYGPPGYPRIRVYAAPGSAQPGTAPPVVAMPLRSLPYTHDGFYLRMGVGGGVTSASRNDGAAGKVTLLSGGASISIAAGWSVARDLALFGTLFVSGMDAPEVKVNGVSMNTAGTSASFGGFGAGAAYFVEPINIYLSAALATMALRLADSNDQTIYGTDWGLGFQAMAGKEWWVTPEWNAGIAAEMKTAWLKDSGPGSQPWSAASYSLVFSMTYN